MELIVTLVVVAAIGAGIGALARLFLPGPDPMPFWVMTAIGVVSALVAGAIGFAILRLAGALIFSVLGAVGLVYGYRRWKARREGRGAPAVAGSEVQPTAPTPPAQTAAASPPAMPVPVDRDCSNCGTPFKGDERFCTNCGRARE